MEERGVDMSSHRSKGLEELPKHKWDYVITMGCGDACPFVPSRGKEDWAIPDPKHLSPDEFRKVRDLVESKVKDLIARAVKAGA
jgi:protein-tyrosine-phosphatase